MATFEDDPGLTSGTTSRRDDRVDAVRYTLNIKPVGIGGWLLGYILSLVAAVAIYGRALLNGVADREASIVGLLIVSTIFASAVVAVIMLLSKCKLGVTVAKVFHILNFLVWLAGAWLFDVLIPIAMMALLWAVISWWYLNVSVRVKNTLS